MANQTRLPSRVRNLIAKGGLDTLEADFDAQYAFFAARRVIWFRALTNASGVFSITWPADTWPVAISYLVRTVSTVPYPTTTLDLPPVIVTDVADYEDELEVNCFKWDTVTISGSSVLKSTPVAVQRLLHIVCFDPQEAPTTLTNES